MHGAGKLTLVADLGSCLVQTDTALAATLTADEAALYECIKLRVKDVSAYVVDGDFSFAAIEDAVKAEAGKVRCDHVSSALLGPLSKLCHAHMLRCVQLQGVGQPSGAGPESTKAAGMPRLALEQAMRWPGSFG